MADSTATSSGMTGIAGITTVVFDIDGTLLDSAAGILAGFRRALVAGGVATPAEADLRIHLCSTDSALYDAHYLWRRLDLI